MATGDSELFELIKLLTLKVETDASNSLKTELANEPILRIHDRNVMTELYIQLHRKLDLREYFFKKRNLRLTRRKPKQH